MYQAQYLSTARVMMPCRITCPAFCMDTERLCDSDLKLLDCECTYNTSEHSDRIPGNSRWGYHSNPDIWIELLAELDLDVLILMRVHWIGGTKVWTAEGGIGETGSTKRDLALDGPGWLFPERLCSRLLYQW